MRSFLFDELIETEIEAVKKYLDQTAVPSGLENLYWLPLPRELWNQNQLDGRKESGWMDGDEFRLAVEVGPDWVKFELLVRSEGLLNIGGGQADEKQSMYVLFWADEMARKLNLSTCLNHDGRRVS